MTLMEKKALISKLQPILGKELVNCHSKYMDAFIQHALNDSAEITFNDILRHILGKGIHAGNVLTSLLQCEQENIQYLLLNCKTLTISEQASILSDCVKHYNNLQSIILEEAEATWISHLESEKTSRILAESKITWLRQKHIELHNYFQEIPVRVSFELLDIEGEVISVLFSEEAGMLFSASQDSKSAYISVSHDMRLMVRGIERKGNKLKLMIENIEADLMSRRKHVRVAVPTPIPITLHGKKEYQAHVRDMSDLGMGVLLSKGLGIRLIEARELNIGDEVQCCWSAEGIDLNTPAVVCWIKEVRGEYRAGLAMKSNHKTRDDLQRFLMGYQRGVISRLRGLSLPSWLSMHS
ncbi:MAG: PilZ domain-containing protein [Mariprofundaceae bacterium]|nr:PilZ domain-containing protein [Mariprofundaceae bacterium]